ncbi:unnamed protein product [Cunninghamella echinulata]
MNHAQMNEVLPPDTLHQLFGNLNSLVDFQRRFLIQVEAQADNIPMEQRFGLLFVQFEDAFKVYEPFCANFQTAQDLIVTEVQALEKLAHILSPSFELPSILIKPVQRICKYPLLMKELVKSTPSTWTYYDETEEGLNAILRVASKVNETKRRQENHAIVQDLKKRVYDWSITDIDDYGNLLLHDRFMIYRGQPGRELTVYLFEDCLFVCREEKLPSNSLSASTSSDTSQKKKKNKKDNNVSQLDSSSTATASTSASSTGADYRLNVRGRILMSRIAQVVDASKDGICNLQIYWSNKTNHAKENNNQQQQNYGIESFTLKCRHQEQLQLWESTLSTLLKQIKQKAREQKTAFLLASANNNNSSSSSPPPSSSLVSNHSSPSEHGSYTVPNTPTTAYGYSLSDHLEQTFIHPTSSSPSPSLEEVKELIKNEEHEGEEDEDEDDHPLYTFTSSYHANLNQVDNNINNSNSNNNGRRLSYYNTTPGMSLPPLPRDVQPLSQPSISSSSYLDHDHYQSVPATELVTQHMLNEYEETEGYNDHYNNFDTYFSITSPPATPFSFLSSQPSPHSMNKPLPSLSNNSQNSNNPTRLRSQSSPNIHQPLKNHHHHHISSYEKVSTTPSLPPLSNNSIYHHYHTLYSSPSSSSSNHQHSYHSDYHEMKQKQDKRKSNGDQDLNRPLYSFDHHHHQQQQSQQQKQTLNEDYYYYHPTSINSNDISPTGIKVKVHHSGSIYVLVVPLSVDYKELVERIEKKMNCDMGNSSPSTSSQQQQKDMVMNGLKYQDEDGDLITISSNDDLQMGFELRGLNNTVNFYIV